MAKLKLNLTPDPTFKAKVSIPVPGGRAADVEFTFRHRTKDAFTEFMKANENSDDLDVISGHEVAAGEEKTDAQLGVAVNWELEEPFNRENVERLLQNYSGAAKAVIGKYCEEVGQVRLGNFAR